MRKIVIFLLILLAVHIPSESDAQLNKAYIYWVGREFLIEDKYEAAIETLNILLKVDPEAHEAYFLRGIAKYNLDDLLGAEYDFSMAIQYNPVFTLAFQYRAITRSRLGNYDDALRDFEEAITLRPDRPGVYYSRGVTYFLSQQFEKAIEDFDQFIKYENKVTDAYINRGTSYLFLKDTLSAYENYEMAIRTNREDPNGYHRRGSLKMAQKKYEEAIEDFDMAIRYDDEFLPAYFNRAIANSNLNKYMASLADFDQVIKIDSTNSLTYFNRAIIRSQIGDYGNALEDYNKVAYYSPNNVLVYYNRAALNAQLGNYHTAIQDYNTAIELYPDFANAYLNRSNIKYQLRDLHGAQQDRSIAELKIAEYRSKLNDSTFSIYADTSRRFNQLLAFDTKMPGSKLESNIEQQENIVMMPLFKFTFARPDSIQTIDPHRYYLARVEDFHKEVNHPYFMLTTRESDIPTDSLVMLDREFSELLNEDASDWLSLFKKGITQSLIKQYTNSVNTYTAAIERNPTNPFLYLNRSTTRSEMIDFISSIDNSYQRIAIESDPASRLKNRSTRTYNYDEAIADLNKAAKLFPECAYIYYNRACLYSLSGMMPEAYDDFTYAIELNPNFAEAYYNRGLVQIYLKDTRKGCLDISKAGELGIKEAYTVLKRYSFAED